MQKKYKFSVGTHYLKWKKETKVDLLMKWKKCYVGINFYFYSLWIKKSIWIRILGFGPNQILTHIKWVKGKFLVLNLIYLLINNLILFEIRNK